MNYLRFVGEQATFVSRKWGKLTVESASFTPASDGDLVVYIGDISRQERINVRIHSECVFSEVFDSNFCDCADQLQMAMRCLKQTGGILFYLRFDGRGAGLSAKVKATQLEVQGMNTYDSRVKIGVAPEGRDFSNVGYYLIKRGYRKITLLTNNPTKEEGLVKAGIDVRRMPLLVDVPNDNVKLLYRTKKEKFGHFIP